MSSNLGFLTCVYIIFVMVNLTKIVKLLYIKEMAFLVLAFFLMRFSPFHKF